MPIVKLRVRADMTAGVTHGFSEMGVTTTASGIGQGGQAWRNASGLLRR